jgi:hypothetical protein
VLAAGAAGVVALGAGLAAVRLAQGPVEADWLRDAAERALVGELDGGRASVERAALVWFGDAGALGVRLEGVRLTDRRGRDVLQAKRLEAGAALGALVGFRAAAGRVAAEDFFVAASVSRQGRYALGYEASGDAPERASELHRLFQDLTGAPRHGRPASWLRQIDLKRGRIAFRQVGGAVAWTGDVRRVRFDKVGQRFSGVADLSVAPAGGAETASLRADARGRVGLEDVSVDARLSGLRPSRVFPNVGATRRLAALDAVVEGRTALSYALKTGLRTADVRLVAGSGLVRAGSSPHRFVRAEVLAAYRPATRDVALSRLQVVSDRLDLDLTGRVALTPEDARRGRPAAFEFGLAAPAARATLAADAAPQALADVSARGRFIPARRRLEIDEARGRLGEARLQLSAAADRNRAGGLGLTLKGEADGAVGPAAVFAFWPKGLAAETRDWVRKSVVGGRFDRLTVNIDAPDGALGRPVLKDRAMDIRFRFREAAVKFDPAFPAVDAGVGVARVQGNRFDLTLDSGRIGEARLSEGVITIPRFRPGGAPATFKARATGPLDGLLRVIDGPGLRLVSDAGLAPERVGGVADVRVEIVRPMLLAVPIEDYRIRYAGTVSGARLADAALGWDLEQGAVRVEGDAKGLRAWGRGTVGPYRGAIEYRSDFDGPDRIETDGVVLASAVGGLPGRTAPFAAVFTLDGGVGRGRVASTLFQGEARWIDTPGEGRFTLEGVSQARALQAVQAPLTAGLPDRVPTRLTMTRAGGTWRGDLSADALSGALAFTPGDRARLAYRTEISPAEAARLGLSGVPLFGRPQAVTVDTVWGERDGRASVRIGSLAADVDWTDRADGTPGERRARARLTRADLAALGVPDVFRPPTDTPVAASWLTHAGGTDLTLDVAGVPVRLRSETGGQTVASALVDAGGLRRLGLDLPVRFEGVASVTARWRGGADGSLAGTIDADLTGAALALPRGLWSKRAGRPGRLAFAFRHASAGGTHLQRLSVAADGLDLDGALTLDGDGRIASLDLVRAQVESVYDGALRYAESPNARSLSLRGRRLDLSRLLEDDGPAQGRAATDAVSTPVRLDAIVGTVRLGRNAALQDVRATGAWGGVGDRRLNVTARTVGAATLTLALAPAGTATAVRAETADAGAAAQALFGVATLEGGEAVVTGRLVEDGADLTLDARDVRLIRAPTMAQILTLGSLDGLADTLNGEGVRFNRVFAPVKLRGDRLTVAEARATGSALGLTTKGVADLGAGTLDFEGTLAPAYALNSFVGVVPIVGKMLVSREGEGVVGLGWSAKGSLDRPRIAVNPLSLVTPGVLRRIFEADPTASAPPETKGD